MLADANLCLSVSNKAVLSVLIPHSDISMWISHEENLLLESFNILIITLWSWTLSSLFINFLLKKRNVYFQSQNLFHTLLRVLQQYRIPIHKRASNQGSQSKHILSTGQMFLYMAKCLPWA